MYDEVYSIEIRKEQPPPTGPTNVAAGLETSLGTTEVPMAKKGRPSPRIDSDYSEGETDVEHDSPRNRRDGSNKLQWLNFPNNTYRHNNITQIGQPYNYSNVYPGPGGKISRKRRPNKLTRKKQKKIKARKTRHKAKKHRYTRRNKK
jgi:hypothetical protein